MDIPKEVDGFEAFVFFRKLKELLLTDSNDSSKIFTNFITYDTGNGIDSFLQLQFGDSNQVMFYNSSYGKIIFNNYYDFQEFIKQFNIVK